MHTSLSRARVYEALKIGNPDKVAQKWDDWNLDDGDYDVLLRELAAYDRQYAHEVATVLEASLGSTFVADWPADDEPLAALDTFYWPPAPTDRLNEHPRHIKGRAA